MEVIAAIAGAVLAAIFTVAGYYNHRHYSEQRDFRKYMYDKVHALEKQLATNCTITQEIRDRVRIRKENGLMFNADCWERIGRAFLTGTLSAAVTLGLFANGTFDITDVAHHWKPLVGGGLFAVLTLIKAQAGMGRGDNPDKGVWKGIGNSSSE